MPKIILVFFLISISHLFANCKSADIQERDTVSVSEIPYFTLYTLDSKRFTKDSFDKKRAKLILYFNSECEHCEKQAKWLAKDIELFSDIEMVFVSFEEMGAIKKFRDLHEFNQKNITFLQDARLTFSNKFEVESFPSILIYSKKGKLIHKFQGETKAEKLLEFIPKG